MPLSPGQRAALGALCRTIVPDAYEHRRGEGSAPVDLARAVELRLDQLDPVLTRRFAALLTAFDHPLTALVTSGRLRRFSASTPIERETTLGGWEISGSPARRTVYQALRRLILSTWYSTPHALRDLDWREPLHTRAAELPWEGALPGTSREDEPVARRATAPDDRTPRPDARSAPGLSPLASIGPPAADSVILADVCIVGTGAGGAVAGARLAEAGRQVVMLEEGRWWDLAEFSEREAEMMPRLYAESAARATEDLAIPLLQGVAVGGSALVNWLVMLRTPDYVLEEWQQEHGTEGMSPADMAAVFALVEHETHTHPVPDDAHSPTNRALLDGARALGWHATAAAINTHGCVRSGACGLGCRYGAKQGPATVYVPRALQAGAQLFTSTRVDRIESSRRGRRVHASVLDERGRSISRVTVEARTVVLAAGAVGTPAILLRSRMGGAAAGRFLRLHPTTAVVGVYAREMYAAAGIPLSAVCDEFTRGADGYGFWIECPPLYPAFGSAAVPGFGRAHRERMRQFPRMGPSIVLVRDGAQRGLSSGSVRLDRRNRPVIRYRLADLDRRTMIRGVQAAARLQLAAGASEAFTLHARDGSVSTEADVARLEHLASGPNQLAMFSAHLNGTARLGTNRHDSVCTPDGQIRGAAGVYICDGSVLPTAPGVNPQETIMAVATVIARRIADR